MGTHAVLPEGDRRRGWNSLACPRAELRLDLTLACAQTFRWRERANGHWTGVMKGRVWTLTQTDDTLWYYVYRAPGDTRRRNTANEMVMLRDYFQLDVNLQDLYWQWGSLDNHFQRIARTFPGVRVLRQDPTECLFSMICTSNNNISRIKDMVENLCKALGDPLLELDQTPYHDFPSVRALADTGVEAQLRRLGFGYRAPYVNQSAIKIMENGLNWLNNLRGLPYPDACNTLQELPGVGIKVANCVCLMSLNKANAVPIDTHMRQIARRDYDYPVNKENKITDRLSRNIGDFFRQLWGPHAGWAQAVLFCADLRRDTAEEEGDG